MTTNNIPADTPLQRQLDEFRAQVAERIPAEVGSQLQQPIQQLIASGAAERALKEGQQVEDFTLPDALGRAVTLSHLLKEGPVVVIFYRGSWCPYCNLELRAYQQALPQLQALGASLVAISPQTPDGSLSTVEKAELTFTVLSDAGNRVAHQFGLVYTIDESLRATHQMVGVNLPQFNGEQSWELPIPGTFLIDQSGTVRLSFVNPDFTYRLDPSVVIARLKELQQA